MQQSDATSSYYQYYQSHLQNPNPNPSSNPNDPHPPHLNTLPATFASAPPVLSGYPSSDYSSSSSSSAYPPYPQYTDHAPNPPPTYPTNPNSQSLNPSPQPYAFPHLNPQPTPYYPYDQNQAALSYDHSISAQNSNPNPNPNSNSNSSFSTTSYSSASNYENLYESGANYGRHGDQRMYGEVSKPWPDVGLGHDYGRFRDGVGGGDGVYAYNGGNKEPYGARGSGSESSSRVIFDDYGRPIGFSNGKEQTRSAQAGKAVKANPKAEAQPEDGSGVQKYRVKLLSEGAGQSDMDVLCQVCDAKEAYWIFILFSLVYIYLCFSSKWMHNKINYDINDVVSV